MRKGTSSSLVFCLKACSRRPVYPTFSIRGSTEHIQRCLLTYYDDCDGNMESHDGVVRLSRLRILSNRYNPTTWAKESKTGYFLGQIYHENKS